jgi:hypothetical protein
MKLKITVYFFTASRGAFKMVKGPVTSGYKNHCVCQWRHVSSVLEVRHFFSCEYVLGNHMILYVIGTLYDLHDLHQNLLEIDEGWDPINQFNPTTFLCLSQTRTWISNVVVFFMFNILRQEVVVRFVDIDGIVDHHCLNFLFIIFLCGVVFIL